MNTHPCALSLHSEDLVPGLRVEAPKHRFTEVQRFTRTVRGKIEPSCLKNKWAWIYSDQNNFNFTRQSFSDNKIIERINVIYATENRKHNCLRIFYTVLDVILNCAPELTMYKRNLKKEKNANYFVDIFITELWYSTVFRNIF